MDWDVPHSPSVGAQLVLHECSRQFLCRSPNDLWLRLHRIVGSTFYSQQVPVSINDSRFILCLFFALPDWQFWLMLISSHFLFSSIYSELVDTFFIIIHKKPLIFLHWYHHITVLLYCWHSYVTTSPPGIFFVVMNYSVHASMYGYYFLMAMKLRPKWFNPMIITAFQISQMIVGVVVTLLGFYYYTTDSECKIEKENNTAAFVMYGSYLFLFLQFFIGRYFNSKAKKQKTV